MGVSNFAKFGTALLAGVFACAAAYADDDQAGGHL